MNWRRATIAAALVVPVVWIFLHGMKEDPREIPSPLPGKPAPQFSLAVFSPGQPPLERPVGDSIRLGDLKGRVVVLNFWASWCLSCRDEHVTLSEVAKEYAGKPVQFVGSLYQDQPNAGLQWIREMGGQSYPSVDDPHARTAIDYGLYGVPETFIISPDGRIAHKITGPATHTEVKKVVDSLLASASSP